MTPPQALRHELERQRDRGRPFRVAWPIALHAALDDLSRDQQAWWRITLSDQRGVWSVSYQRLPWPANRRPGLMVPEREPTARAATQLVA